MYFVGLLLTPIALWVTVYSLTADEPIFSCDSGLRGRGPCEALALVASSTSEQQVQLTTPNHLRTSTCLFKTAWVKARGYPLSLKSCAEIEAS